MGQLAGLTELCEYLSISTGGWEGHGRHDIAFMGILGSWRALACRRHVSAGKLPHTNRPAALSQRRRCWPSPRSKWCRCW